MADDIDQVNQNDEQLMQRQFATVFEQLINIARFELPFVLVPVFPEPLRSRSPLASLPCPILRHLSSSRVAALGHPSPGPGVLRRGCGAALGAREEPWAGRVHRRVGLGVCCRSGGAKMPCVFPIRG